MHVHQLGQMAIDRFGKCSQLVKSVEELSELSQAICKDLNSSPLDNSELRADQVREEIADVRIMVGQLEILYGLKECQKWLDIKTNRLAILLNGGVKE